MGFRFENLEIWQISTHVCRELFEIADHLEGNKLYRWAEQLRGSGLSMPNNSAEGSGFYFSREFAQFLNIAKRPAFESANILIIVHQKGIIEFSRKERLLEELDELCRKIHNFRKTLIRIFNNFNIAWIP
jgi:four helix bundle protein